MKSLQVKTNGNRNPNGKPRVYFSCHPEDFDTLFPIVTKYLLSAFDCAIYYYHDEPELDDSFFSDLKRIHLWVIPVTQRLLTTANRSMNTEFPYVRKHNIPVLPFLMEPGLDRMYSQHFGTLHYLNPMDRDKTALHFEHKLKSYLENVLLDNEMIRRIRAEFDAGIFLSYRKTDRILAQDLMRRIHEIPQCRDVAFWYDEFLIAGRDYVREIEQTITDCDVFVLVMTPQLLIPGNYVITKELPIAKERVAKRKLKIIAVEMEPINQMELRGSSVGTLDVLKPEERVLLCDRFVRSLGSKRLRRRSGSEHDFLIGTAYLYGIDMEIDQQRGLELISKAAYAGNTEAMEMLSDIYETGNGVPMDLRLSTYWQEKLVSIAKEAYEGCRSENNAELYVYHVLKLMYLYSQTLNYGKLEQVHEQIEPILEDWMRHSSNEDLSSLLLDYYRLMASFYLAYKPLTARRWFSRARKLEREIKDPSSPVSTDSYFFKADALRNNISFVENSFLRIFYPTFLKKIILLRELYYQYKGCRCYPDNDDPDEDYRHQKRSRAFDDIGNIWNKIGLLTAAAYWYNKALRIRLPFKDDPQSAVKEDLIDSYLNLSHVCLQWLERIRTHFSIYLLLDFLVKRLVEQANIFLQKAQELQLELQKQNDIPIMRAKLIQTDYLQSAVNLDADMMESCYHRMKELADTHPEIKQFRYFEKEMKKEVKLIRNRVRQKI